jgi:hypothetical protein
LGGVLGGRSVVGFGVDDENGVGLFIETGSQTAFLTEAACDCAGRLRKMERGCRKAAMAKKRRHTEFRL